MYGFIPVYLMIAYEFLIDAVRKECVCSMIKYPVGI